MRASNILSGAQRTSEVSLVWKEINSGGGASQIEVPRHTTIRVRCTNGGGMTVSLDGVLSATMAHNEVMLFNSGIGKTYGQTGDLKNTVTLAWSSTCYIQLGMESQEQWQDDI
jgi:hypothetical protein